MAVGDTSSLNILSICNIMKAKDPQECLLKVNHIVSKLSEKEKELQNDEGIKDNFGNR